MKDLYERIQELPKRYRPQTVRQVLKENPDWPDLPCLKIKVVTTHGTGIESWWSEREARKQMKEHKQAKATGTTGTDANRR